MGNRWERWFIGADIGGTTVKLGIYDNEAGDFVKKWEVKTNTANGGESIVSDIAASIKETLPEFDITLEDIAGIGVDVPGPVTSEGVVLECVNLGWGRKDICKEITELLGVTNVAVGNDANVAALGELWRGDVSDYNSVVMVTLGTAVGGGVIIDGKIHTGSNGAGGEIGHITVNPDETQQCGCGMYGHLEQYSSATGIVRLAKKMLDLPVDSDITAKDVLDGAKAGDEGLLEVFETAMKYLGLGLANVASVVDPQAFIIGGGVSKGGSIITETVSKYYNKFTMNSLKNKDFVLAVLGNDAGIYGSVKMAIDNL